MIGSDKERPRAERLTGLIADGQGAEDAGFASLWIPQVPGYLDAMTVIALLGRVTQRIEIGTAVVPVQTRHPVAMAQQALTTQLACDGRLTLGLGPSHQWIIDGQLGLSYERPAHLVRDYLQVLSAAFTGSGPVDIENDTFHVHSPMDVAEPMPMPVLLAALGPVMLQIAGEHADGTVLWMADEKAIGDHIAPKITKAAADAGRPAPRIVAGIPVCLCANSEIDAAKERANRILAEAETSPNYQRLLDRGEARDVGDLCAAGDEDAILARFRQFADAGVTDLSVRLLPIGNNRDELVASKYRTREVISQLATEVQ